MAMCHSLCLEHEPPLDGALDLTCHTHPNLSELSIRDPSGAEVRRELQQCDQILKKQLGIESEDFAFTGTPNRSSAKGQFQAVLI